MSSSSSTPCGCPRERAPLNTLDIEIFRYLNHAMAGFIVPMVALSSFGGGWGSISLVPLLFWQRTRRLGLSLAAVLGTVAVLVYVLKRIVGRVRPCNCLTDIRSVVFEPPTDYSFPSGHSAGSFAFAVFVAIVLVNTIPPDAPASAQLGRRLVAALLVLLALGVGLSRIALGVHFPGDVLAGALLGSTVATIGARRFVKARSARRSLRETTGTDGAA